MNVPAITLTAGLGDGPLGRVARPLLPLVDRLLGLGDLAGVYETVRHDVGSDEFCDRVLAALDVTIADLDTQISRIPRKGPLVVVANHPFGALDGLVLISILRRARPDARLLANSILGRIPEMADACFMVDPFGGPGATSRNVASMRAALEHVQAGGVLGVFPAGEVAHVTAANWRVRDPQWSPTITRLIRRTGTAVLPVHFDDRNSSLFQCLGLIHPLLRTLMLPRELLRRRGATVTVRVGKPVNPARLPDDDREAADYLHLRTDVLGAGLRLQRAGRPTAAALPAMAPLAPPVDPDAMAREITALSPRHSLARISDMEVYCASAAEVPAILTEIGRLRELTFRGVGEGTGRAADLDRFDDHYQHLFIWHHAARKVVGAYRMARTDQVLAEQGIDGLYTRTLFRYDEPLITALGPAFELGRSFVVPEHQREHTPLNLLWRGITAVVARNPDCRRLFGPVSISSTYGSLTRGLLVSFLQHNHMADDLAPLITPRHPLKPAGRGWRDLALPRVLTRDLQSVSELIGDLEAGGLDVPVLLRQYLRLNAKMLAFNVDPDFSDVLDALALVDLTTVDRAILCRFFGRDEAARFLAHHGITTH